VDECPPIYLTAGGGEEEGASGQVHPTDAPNLEWALEGARPNPTSGQASISYSVKTAGKVMIGVYDVAGRLINTLVDGTQSAGLHTIMWNGASNDGAKVRSGVYFWRTTTEDTMARVPARLAKDLDRGSAFAESPKMRSAFRAASEEPKLWQLARKNATRFLESQGVKVPSGLTVRFLDNPTREMPSPDFEFFTIRMFNCRTYWLKKKNAPGFESVGVCFGIEIVPNALPGGPVG